MNSAKEHQKAKPRGRPWKEGQSGNPGGRPKGAKNKLTMAILAGNRPLRWTKTNPMRLGVIAIFSSVCGLSGTPLTG